MQLCVVAVNHSKRSLEVLSISFDHILSIDIVLHKITMGNQEIELFTCDTPPFGAGWRAKFILLNLKEWFLKKCRGAGPAEATSGINAEHSRPILFLIAFVHISSD